MMIHPMNGFIYPLLLKVFLWSFMFADLAIKKPYSLLLVSYSPIALFTREIQEERPASELNIKLSRLWLFAYIHRLKAIIIFILFQNKTYRLLPAITIAHLFIQQQVTTKD